MKLQIVKQELLKVLQFAHEASEKENINSYYSFFILEAKNNCIIIKSANRQMTFEEIIHSSEQTLKTLKNL
jgi:DNA polymerase III sliding clamp (beta) subunit (PCNA family)